MNPVGDTYLPAGPAWCDQFATSQLLDALVEPFQTKAKAFLAALEAGGATYRVQATYRPPERAYLMHFACMIAQASQDPASVPAMAGVNIDWTCGGDRGLAKHQAGEMVKAYGIVYPAALQSRHTQGLAMDVSITLPTRTKKVVTYKGGDGKSWRFGPTDLPSLYRFGASFGVMKLVSDPPHWSSDGH